MTSVLLFPYKTPNERALSTPNWTVNGVALEEVDLTGIDYFSTLNIGCDVPVDLTETELSTGIQASELELVLTVRSESVSEMVVLSRSALETGSVELGGTVRVADIGDSATLRVQLLRTEASATSEEQLVAMHKGAILWDQVAKVRLSGVGSRFSVQAVDLGSEPTFRGVFWQVELDRSDVFTSVSAAAQVRLNSRHETVISILQSDGEVSLAERIVRRQLQLDIARQFILAARQFDSDESPHTMDTLPYDSIGAVAVRFAERLRATSTLQSRQDLWSMLDQDPASFELLLQAAYLSLALEAK